MADYARTSGFDLLAENGYKFLAAEIKKDFPYLTIADVREIMLLGIKGKLDTFKNKSLNFTRVYQWVAGRATHTASFWSRKHPALWDWAVITGVSNPIIADLADYEQNDLPYEERQFASLVSKAVNMRYLPYTFLSEATTNEEVKAIEAANASLLTGPAFDSLKALHPSFVAPYASYLSSAFAPAQRRYV